MRIEIDTLQKRFAVAAVLLIVLVGLSIYYVNNYQLNSQYPTTADIVSKYPEGQTVSISGTIFSYETNGFIVGETYKGQMVYYHVISNISVNQGDHINLLGVLGPNYTVKLTNYVVVPHQSFELVLLRSFVVVPILIVLFLIYWKFDRKSLAFLRRK